MFIKIFLILFIWSSFTFSSPDECKKALKRNKDGELTVQIWHNKNHRLPLRHVLSVRELMYENSLLILQ